MVVFVDLDEEIGRGDGDCGVEELEGKIDCLMRMGGGRRVVVEGGVRVGAGRWRDLHVDKEGEGEGEVSLSPMEDKNKKESGTDTEMETETEEETAAAQRMTITTIDGFSAALACYP
jgi:hypothetical protein